MNPTDKARKEARKKELKKNKKQRLQVRSAVIESKDPEQIIGELRKLDELDVSESNTVATKHKRKRLEETWSKILVHYKKEDPDRYARLQKLDKEYEIQHKKTLAIKAAKEVKLNEIFLPVDRDLDEKIKLDIEVITPLTQGPKPPGCPPNLPPDLQSLVRMVPAKLPPLPLPPPPPQVFSKPIVKPPIKTVETPRQPVKAVIESEPVMFKKRSDIFVPASVRRRKPT